MKNISYFINNIDPSQANITIDTSIYNKEAIHSASYEFTDRYHILVTSNGDDSVLVIFESKTETKNITEDIKNFANSIIDHQVRLQLEKTTGKIRDLIVTHAFSPLDLKKEIKICE